jgi:proteasome activator subunit 4
MNKIEWSKFLPYKVEDNWIEAVKSDFATKLQAENLNGIADCFGNLRLYLDCSYKLDLQDRIYFAKIFYSMSCSQVLQIDLSKQFGDFCVVLIRDEKEMPTEALELDWRPLYDTIYRAMYPKHGRTYHSVANSISALTKLISHASRFFKHNSTHEILQEILPKLNIHDVNNWTHYLALLTIFLPVNQPPLPAKDVNYNGFYWVPTLFNLWGRVVNSSTLDMLFLDLFSRLAKSQISNPNSIGWSHSHISMIYALGTRMLNLPVGSGSSGLESLPLPQNRSKGLSEFGVMDYSVSLASYFMTVWFGINI